MMAGGRDDPTILDISVLCIKGSRLVYDHTHCAVRWFSLVEACLDVRWELEDGRCSRVSEAVLIFSW